MWYLPGSHNAIEHLWSLAASDNETQGFWFLPPSHIQIQDLWSLASSDNEIQDL